jgi:hypothetical protein
VTAPAVADASAAYCAWVRATVGDRLAAATFPQSAVSVPAVFRPSLPEWFDSQMPAACVVVRPAGGYRQFGKTMLALADPALDVLCYAASQQQATSICQTLAVASKQLVNEVWEGTIICSAGVNSGPTPLPDTQTLWPTCFLSVVLVHGELPVPPEG